MRYFYCSVCSSLVCWERHCGQRALPVHMEEPNLYCRYPMPSLPIGWRTRTRTLSKSSGTTRTAGGRDGQEPP